jgi:hypothetical protein
LSVFSFSPFTFSKDKKMEDANEIIDLLKVTKTLVRHATKKSKKDANEIIEKIDLLIIDIENHLTTKG